ncbi:radical SAM protein [Algibacillus agarilyticus]|uniref:radical SAM protein n=1 Tax=Algibacillus agarilyticus TaxID=2234133 RepID=UPI0018E51190|nr:radical SAM protein [Algibacillus agarilyticus]
MTVFNINPNLDSGENTHTSQVPKQYIHLLYVPTIFCNLGCHYCYLGKQTDTKTLKEDNQQAVETLAFALDYFAKANILPFNLSLHGGEVTAVPADTLNNLFNKISAHYLHHYDELMANGFRKQTPHIKTNLFNFDKHQALLKQHHVSISGSVDLPFFLHDKYRTTKTNKSTLAKIKKNIQLLGQYPHGKKLSATLFNEHFQHVEQIIDDIWYIHRELRFDMNNFNFMFGFESDLNEQKFENRDKHDTQSLNTESINEEHQIAFYQAMKKEFTGTELEWGFKRNWFDEFTPSYCTNAQNCGERFFLLQSNGDVYSCVRGQGAERFFYGNIFKVPAHEILNNGKQNIRSVHQEQGLHRDCAECEYLKICNTGCAFVKNEKNSKKSYTCALQKQIYREYPQQYKAALGTTEQALDRQNYQANIHPQLNQDTSSKEDQTPNVTDDMMLLSSDFYEHKNALGQLIKADPILQALYASNTVLLSVNGVIEPLNSQILKTTRALHFLEPSDQVILHIKKAWFFVHCNDPLTNTLYLQLLRDTKVVYGDEQREKQEHLFTQQIFFNQLLPSSQGEDWLQVDLLPLLNWCQHQFISDVANNLLITTQTLRDYHYKKQQKNAFYHIQAINLPFQNIEFFWCKDTN